MENQILNQILYEIKDMKTDIKELKTDVGELKADVSTLKTDVRTLKTDVSELKTDVRTLKTDVSNIKNQLDDLEVKNANNHLEIKQQLEQLSKDVAIVEVVAGKNMTDIAFLKAVK